MHALLQQLWPPWTNDPASDTHYFVDAICIDQSSVTERAAEVTLMGQIYEKADAVIVWLGYPEPNGLRAVRSSFRLYNKFFRLLIREGIRCKSSLATPEKP